MEYENISKQLDKKSKVVKDLNNKIRSLEAENKELLKNNTQLLNKIKNYKKEVTEYKNLNIDLQKKVVEQMKECQGMTDIYFNELIFQGFVKFKFLYSCLIDCFVDVFIELQYIKLGAFTI